MSQTKILDQLLQQQGELPNDDVPTFVKLDDNEVKNTAEKPWKTLKDTARLGADHNDSLAKVFRFMTKAKSADDPKPKKAVAKKAVAKKAVVEEVVAAKSQTPGHDEPVESPMSMGSELATNSTNPLIVFMREMRERDENIAKELVNVKRELCIVNDTGKLAAEAYAADPDNDEELKAAAVDLYLDNINNETIKDAAVQRLQDELDQAKEGNFTETFEMLEDSDGCLTMYEYNVDKTLRDNIHAYARHEVKVNLEMLMPNFTFKADECMQDNFKRFFDEAMEHAAHESSGSDNDDSSADDEVKAPLVKKPRIHESSGSDNDDSSADDEESDVMAEATGP